MHIYIIQLYNYDWMFAQGLLHRSLTLRVCWLMLLCNA